MDSQDLPGVVLCPDRPHDDKILLFFFEILVKNGHFDQNGPNGQNGLFLLFFSIFLYLWGVSPIEHPQTTPQNHL